jgi:hypothetical protein
MNDNTFLSDDEIEKLFNSDRVANDPMSYEIEKELSENFTKKLSIKDKFEVLKRIERI